MDKSIHSVLYAVFLRVFRETRQRAGLTQVQVAARVGQTQSFVSKCERGERRIDVAELHVFCEAFGLSLDQFLRVWERAIAEARLVPLRIKDRHASKTERRKRNS
jgi:transcriptional regulator with XRE-family HTH domain